MNKNRYSFKIFGIKISFINIFKKYNNKIILTKDGKSKRIYFVRGLKVKFSGANNTIEFIDEIPRMENVRILCGNNSNIQIANSEHKIKNLFIEGRADNISISIGKDFSIESGYIDFHGENNTSVSIGDDCQFGCNINIDTADGHTVYDFETKQPLNKPEDVKIGNHVWFCRNVSILKGAEIPDNCVVAKCSVVISKFTETNRIIAGIPATQKSKKIDWTRQSYQDFISNL